LTLSWFNLNWVYYGLNLYENLQNLAALLGAYIKMLLMAALICTYTVRTYKHAMLAMKNKLQTNNTHCTVDPFLK